MNEQNLLRYHRQYLYSAIGEEGQRKLLSSRVAVLGCGALGSVIANTLARAGVGFLRIVDRDFVELNNLQRQVLFDEEDIRENLPKAIAAKRKLEKINSKIQVEAIVADVNFSNIENFIEGVDLVLDGMDNFETRFLMNDACVKHHLPWIYGACIGSHGLTMVVIPEKTPCLRCVFESAPPPELSPTCDTAGILGPVVNIIASLEAGEAIKFLTGNLDALDRSLYTFELWNRSSRGLQIEGLRERTDCPTCRQRKFEFLSGEKGTRHTTLCGRNAVQISRDGVIQIDFASMAARLRQAGEVRYNNFLLKLKVEKYEITLFPDGRAIVQGTNDANVARTLYAKYVSV